MDEERRGNNSARRNHNVGVVMEKERGNCRNPSHCEYMRNRQRNLPVKESMEILYTMPDFEPTASEQEQFYDCISENDPYEGNIRSGKPNDRFDDPEAFRIALQRAADAAQILLNDLDNKPSNKVVYQGKQQMSPCAANLEITARMTSMSGSQENDIRCNPFRVRIEPITINIPIKLDVMGGSMTSAGVREPILTATVEGSHYSGPQTDRDRNLEYLNYPDEEQPNDQRSQTDASYLTDQNRNLQRQNSDEDLDPNEKKSQTDTSFLKDKAIKEGRIRPEEQEKRVNERMEESSEPDKSKTEEPTEEPTEKPTEEKSADDPNAKPSQTDASFLREKKTPTDGGVNAPQQVDDTRASFNRPDKVKYPTNFRINDEGELFDEKVSKEVICKCSNTNELKIEKKLKGVSSEDEMGEIGCKCKTEKSGYDDGIEDLCSPNVMKESCDGRRRSDAASNDEVPLSEDRPNWEVHSCCNAEYPCRSEEYPSDDETTKNDIFILSQRDIKTRGGFKPKYGEYKSKSWLTYGVRPTAYGGIQRYEQQQPQEPQAPQGPHGQYDRQYKQYDRRKYGDKDDDDDGEGFVSCESDTEASVVCRCTADHNCRHDKSMPCICRKQSARSNKSQASQYKSSCSVTAKRSGTNNNDDGKKCVCGSYKGTRSVKSSTSTSVSPKQTAPCGGSSNEAPPCDECQEQPDICEDCGKKVVAKESCSQQPSEDDKQHSCHCSTTSLTCRDDAGAPCHTISSRKEKIMRLINNLTDVCNCSGISGEDRSEYIAQLFKELTYLLGRDVTVDKEKNLDCCLFKMQEYINECFLKDLPPPKKKKHIGKIELYNVERDPDFVYTTSNASKLTKDAGGEEERDGYEDCSGGGGGGKGGGTSGDDGEEEGDAEGVKVNTVNIGEDNTTGECGDCESDDVAFFGDCNACEEAAPATECAPCEEVTPTDCNACDEVTPAATDCNVCEEEMSMVRSGGPCPDSEVEPECDPCQCCHCRAMRCEKECRTVNKTVECAMLDPVCELRYFIDSIIFDLDAMDQVLHDKKASTKSVKPKKVNNPCKDTFPVEITQVHDIGMTSLFVSWEIFDCCGIGGYEVYIDGQLSNRLFSPCHQATVLCNVNINKEHQVVLRATPIGAELPGDGGCGCSKSVARKSQQPPPDRGPGSCKPWKASVFYYHPC